MFQCVSMSVMYPCLCQLLHMTTVFRCCFFSNSDHVLDLVVIHCGVSCPSKSHILLREPQRQSWWLGWWFQKCILSTGTSKSSVFRRYVTSEVSLLCTIFVIIRISFSSFHSEDISNLKSIWYQRSTVLMPNSIYIYRLMKLRHRFYLCTEYTWMSILFFVSRSTIICS